MISRTSLPSGVTTFWLAGGLLVSICVRLPPWRWIPAVLVGGLTDLFDNPWVVLGAVLVGGLPLLVVNALEARRR